MCKSPFVIVSIVWTGSRALTILFLRAVAPYNPVSMALVRMDRAHTRGNLGK